MLRNLIRKYADYKIPEIPEPIPAIEIPPIQMLQTSSIWQNLPKPFNSPQPQPMEMFDQNQGLILYSTELIGHKGGKLTIWEPHDYALVFLNHKFIDTVFDISNYSKGFVFVNGHNLGRYWNIGPQQRLYCPAGWLKKGRNEIIVFDLHQPEAASISGKTSLE